MDSMTESARDSVINRIQSSVFEGHDCDKYAIHQLSISTDSDTIMDSNFTYSQLSESVNRHVSSLRSFSLSQSTMALLILDVRLYE